MSTQVAMSETESTVLKVLWDRGPGTVREVLSALTDQGHDWAYTTVQTLLTRLATKGYAEIDRASAAHVYRAAVSKDALLKQELFDLADTYCEGTSSPLVLALVEGGRFTADEIARFRELLDRLENDKPTSSKKKGGRS